MVLIARSSSEGAWSIFTGRLLSGSTCEKDGNRSLDQTLYLNPVLSIPILGLSMVIPSSSDKLETLNELTQLRDSGFGRRRPRHGLRLLHWLARDCFSVDSALLCDPERGDYGFHYFKNSEYDLPVLREDHSYYEVGNLNLTNAQFLPIYVMENYQWNVAVSNSDRLILSVGPENIIDRIYATKHKGKGSFDSEHTYRISKGLMKVIKRSAMGSYSQNSSKTRTLNTVKELGAVKFGHRFPRHGLKLLHWLANNMVKFDNTRKMWAQQNPGNGDFGFHPFHNAERILPDPPFQSSYFEVGNLHVAGAQSLPFGEDQSGNSESNTDRIILSVDSRMLIGSVYITEHTPQNSQFSAKDTYLLSNNLIWSIKGEPLDNFVRQAGSAMGRNSKNPSKIRTLNTVQDLGSVKFGHRFPRHGLKLLHWLANNMVKFDNTRKMWAQQNPGNGDFGFHPFHNAERILPDPPFQSSYFDVGNLHVAGAQSLPFGEDQSGNSESNTDRIILSVDSRMLIGSVYITEHIPHSYKFSAKDTYLLSNNLIWSIKGEPLDNFVRQAGYVPGETNKKAPVSSTVQWDSGRKDFMRQAGYDRDETVPNKRALNESVSIHIPDESSVTFIEDEEEDLLQGHRVQRNFSTDHEDSNCCCCIIL
ncbi:hypothetical protein SKAU_G00392990 [Synaphobranchus kaupii]|uniref:Uncharacterized protein n=1 Tax=Synaphobranchus kaupii TaxID=118154 RepID=A0A9Q1IDS6_SYNKA|nr:hypothetical protein SKAU_G00392990 [Synaphobranchus kaupii]